jgi:hypothetical protein
LRPERFPSEHFKLLWWCITKALLSWGNRVPSAALYSLSGLTPLPPEFWPTDSFHCQVQYYLWNASFLDVNLCTAILPIHVPKQLQEQQIFRALKPVPTPGLEGKSIHDSLTAQKAEN